MSTASLNCPATVRREVVVKGSRKVKFTSIALSACLILMGLCKQVMAQGGTTRPNIWQGRRVLGVHSILDGHLVGTAE